MGGHRDVRDPGLPRWTTYINVNDVDDVSKKAETPAGPS